MTSLGGETGGYVSLVYFFGKKKATESSAEEEDLRNYTRGPSEMKEGNRKTV